MKIYKRCILQEDYSVLPECCKKRINSKKNRIQSAAAYLLLRDALKENGKDINNISFLETGAYLETHKTTHLFRPRSISA